MHLRPSFAPENKLVRCTRGSILDVVIDLRPDSPTFAQHISVELTADNRRAVYVPTLCAHGFQTLEDATEVHYQMSHAYAPGLDAGLRFDEPGVGVRWPTPVTAISERDRSWPQHGSIDALRDFAKQNLWQEKSSNGSGFI